MHCLKFHSVFPIHYSWNLINFTAQFSMLKQFTDQTLFMSMDVSVREFVCGKPSLSVTGPCYFDTIPNANQKTKTWKSFSTSFNHSLPCAPLKRQEFPITSTDSFNFNWIFMFSCYGKKCSYWMLHIPKKSWGTWISKNQLYFIKISYCTCFRVFLSTQVHESNPFTFNLVENCRSEIRFICGSIDLRTETMAN